MTPEVKRRQEDPVPSEISLAIDRFKQSEYFANLSPNSQYAYGSDLVKLSSFCQKHGILSFSRFLGSYDTFVAELLNRNNKKSTVSRAISATRALLIQEAPDILEHFPQLKFARNRRGTIDQDQVRALIARTQSEKSLRDTALILLLLSTEVKFEELLALKSSEVITRNDRVEIRLERKGKNHIVALDKHAGEALLGYMGEPKTHPTENVFIATHSTNALKFTRQAFWKRLKIYGTDIGIPNLNTQILRNTYQARYKRPSKIIGGK